MAASHAIERTTTPWLGCGLRHHKFFTEVVQREVLEDKYPIILINGLKVAQFVLQLAHKRGLPSVEALLREVDSQYERLVMQRGAEEILYD